ncbi:cation:proton antiporter [Halomarina oriensis]|uniref:Cation:proton antiporter n=1 Tax=Halomarina oriensis TaxID=671145 RepID=A0A6B0GQ25_9EURY|nr:cation:proton antiporter [Halomarina oriensis]MWG34763.1 cation:proton antiporter [Halomarina oriensis]
MAEGTTLLAVGAMFLALVVAGVVARRLGVSVIPLYIVAGIGVGELATRVLPETTPLVPQPASEFVALGAELGIVFLLFFLGLEFSVDRLLASRDRLLSAGLLDLGVNFPVGMAIGLAAGWSPVEAFVLGGVVYVSSSAVITKSLIDLGWIANAESEPMLGTLVFEDLAIALYLAVLSAIVFGGGDLATAVEGVGVAAGFLLVLVAGVAKGDALFARYLDVDSNELFVLRAVAVTTLVGGVALELGVSEAVAAFFVGMGFSSTQHVHALERLLAPIRDVFAAVFFFYIGLTTELGLVGAVVGLLAVAVVLTTASKLVSGYLTGQRVYGLDHRRSVRVAAGMVTRGEFSLIIAALVAGASSTVLSGTIPAFAVGYVLVMSVLGTLAMQYADRIAGLVPGGS